MISQDVDRAIKYLKDKLQRLHMHGDMDSVKEYSELQNILAVIKSLTGRK